MDSSILCRRPRILDEMKKKEIQYICITETVLSEMNYQKDKGRRRQQAWLAMKTFNDNREKDPNRFQILEEKEKKELNDDNIINAALNKAKEDNSLMVYLISDDIYFQLRAKNTQNFRVLTLSDYEREFSLSELTFDREASINFYGAVNAKNIEQAKKILNKNPDINRIDAKNGFTPIIQAIRNKDESMLEFLLSLPELDINKCDETKYCLPPISHTVQITHIDFLKTLIKNGADIDKGSKGTNYGNTALMIAAWHGRLDFVKYLVEQGACCNQQDSNGYTPLIKSCIKNHPEVAKYLFDKTDRKIHSHNDYKTAKDFAKKMEDVDLIYKFTKDEEDFVSKVAEK